MDKFSRLIRFSNNANSVLFVVNEEINDSNEIPHTCGKCTLRISSVYKSNRWNLPPYPCICIDGDDRYNNFIDDIRNLIEIESGKNRIGSICGIINYKLHYNMFSSYINWYINSDITLYLSKYLQRFYE